MIGRTLGKYRLVGRLGRGGMGTVYKAVDVTLEREVAIKVLNPEIADPKVVQRFRREATTLARLNHPGIATIHELLPWETDLLIVMELVHGETLEAVAARSGALPPNHAVYVVDNILSALAHAHGVGIVHCDIKPANVMVTAHGGVKIMDFGTARVRGAERTTIDGYMMGTPAYMAPEQVLGREFDARVDLYAVGVVWYRLLTGALPFDAETTIAVVQKQLSEMPPPLATHRDGLPDWCETIALRALAKSAADRFQTASEFRKTLGDAAGAVSTTEVMQAFSVPIGDIDGTGTPELSPLEDCRTTPLPSPAPHTLVLAEATAVSDGRVGIGRRPVGHSLWPESAQAIASLFATRPYTSVGAVVLALAVLTATALWRPTRFMLARAVSAPTGVAKVSGLPEPFVFEARTLLLNGVPPRERWTRVVLANGKVSVEAGTMVLQEARYDEVVSITYSRGADPVWNAPSGPKRVARASRGVLRVFGIVVDRDWLSIQTANPNAAFIILRFDDKAQAKHAMMAIEERTGRKATVAGRSR
jgi:serine/threonine-protein kinase